jgi:hypothetical protein
MKISIFSKILLTLLSQILSLKYQAKISSDIQINSQLGKDQSNQVIATLSNGNFVVVWDSQETHYEVLAQIFDSSLNKVGDEIKVGPTAGDETMTFVIDLKSKNRMVFFWQDKAIGSVSFKIYDYNGTSVTDEINANSFKSDYGMDYASIKAASTSSGNFLMTWQIMVTSIADWDVRGRLFDSDGKPLTDDFTINNSNKMDQSRPSVCTLKNDNFVVAFHGRQHGGFNVYYVILDSKTNVLKSETIIYSMNSFEQKYPYCVALADGGFVIAFVTGYVTGASDLAFIIYDKDGNPSSKEHRINTVLVNPWISVASLATGGFVVTYSSDSTEVYYKVYSSVATVIFPETRIGSTASYSYMHPFVSSFSDSRFIIAWEYGYNSVNGMRRGISMNLFEVISGDCFNLQVFSAQIETNQILAQISESSSIKITQNAEVGDLVDSKGEKLDNVSFYSMNEIYYKSKSYQNDSFYYVINKGEDPCRIEIVMCYPSCQSCSQVGDSLRHNCDSCLTAMDFYPLVDSDTQCYKKTDIINSYEFDRETNLFKHTAGYYNALYGNFDPTASPTISKENDVGVDKILIIIICVFAFIVMIIICKRRMTVKPRNVIHVTLEGQEIGNYYPASRSQEETQSNSVIYRKF